MGYMESAKEVAARQEMLRPYAGMWVALSEDWKRVIVSDKDHATCIAKARATGAASPIFYRIEAADGQR